MFFHPLCLMSEQYAFNSNYDTWWSCLCSDIIFCSAQVPWSVNLWTPGNHSRIQECSQGLVWTEMCQSKAGVQLLWDSSLKTCSIWLEPPTDNTTLCKESNRHPRVNKWPNICNWWQQVKVLHMMGQRRSVRLWEFEILCLVPTPFM